MTDRGSPPEPQGSTSLGGGVFIAVGLLIGAVTGTFMGQASLGAVLGLAAGILIATAIWWKDRR